MHKCAIERVSDPARRLSLGVPLEDAPHPKLEALHEAVKVARVAGDAIKRFDEQNVKLSCSMISSVSTPLNACRRAR
jgi:hypothetical protein